MRMQGVSDKWQDFCSRVFWGMVQVQDDIAIVASSRVILPPLSLYRYGRGGLQRIGCLDLTLAIPDSPRWTICCLRLHAGPAHTINAATTIPVQPDHDLWRLGEKRPAGSLAEGQSELPTPISTGGGVPDFFRSYQVALLAERRKITEAHASIFGSVKKKVDMLLLHVTFAIGNPGADEKAKLAAARARSERMESTLSGIGKSCSESIGAGVGGQMLSVHELEFAANNPVLEMLKGIAKRLDDKLDGFDVHLQQISQRLEGIEIHLGIR